MLRSELNCNCADEWAQRYALVVTNTMVARIMLSSGLIWKGLTFTTYLLLLYALCSMCAPLSQGAYFQEITMLFHYIPQRHYYPQLHHLHFLLIDDSYRVNEINRAVFNTIVRFFV